MAVQFKTFSIVVCSAIGLVIWNEFLVYYVVLLQCYWPVLKPEQADLSIPGVKVDSEPLKAMFLADTHLLGKQGHWFDKLRREWQMHRAFQSALFLFDPEVIFVLGDLLDEGKWCDDEEFEETVARFHSIFNIGSQTQMQLVVGNHDIGFHYMASPKNVKRFQHAFDTRPVKMLQLKNNIFVSLNSIAFEGDLCELCKETEKELDRVHQNLTCSLQEAFDLDGFCEGKAKMQYSKPIVIQHYPMFRENDAECEGPDSAPPSEKFKHMRPKYDCLSQEATEKILSSLNPRLVIDAHTHHFCARTLSDGTPEWTIPSFNWRNKNNPSFLLATITNNNYSLGKCALPVETTVIQTYILGGLTILGALVLYKCVNTTKHRRTRSLDRYTKLS